MSDDLRSNYVFEEPVQREFTVLEKGEYPFEVAEIFEFETSKKGNDMLPVELRVGHPGETTKITEYLVFTKAAKWKIDGFLKSIHGGVLEPGKKIDFDNLGWLQARRGTCEVDVETFTKKDGSEGKRNMITRFTYPTTTLEGRTVTTPSSPVGEDDPDLEDDDIPF